MSKLSHSHRTCKNLGCWKLFWAKIEARPLKFSWGLCLQTFFWYPQSISSCNTTDTMLFFAIGKRGYLLSRKLCYIVLKLSVFSCKAFLGFLHWPSVEAAWSSVVAVPTALSRSLDDCYSTTVWRAHMFAILDGWNWSQIKGLASTWLHNDGYVIRILIVKMGYTCGMLSALAELRELSSQAM